MVAYDYLLDDMKQTPVPPNAGWSQITRTCVLRVLCTVNLKILVSLIRTDKSCNCSLSTYVTTSFYDHWREHNQEVHISTSTSERHYLMFYN